MAQGIWAQVVSVTNPLTDKTSCTELERTMLKPIGAFEIKKGPSTSGAVAVGNTEQ
jgi:hypothetical protein